MMADHDKSYKHPFSRAEMVRDLLLGFVKEGWGRQYELKVFKLNAEALKGFEARELGKTNKKGIMPMIIGIAWLAVLPGWKS